MTLEESFEPIFMFFGLTNSPATFQTVINEILLNLINTGEVASFIDNVIVWEQKGRRGMMRQKKRHDVVVEEIVKRLTENDLYMKLEKYKWKIRELGFLEVVIRLKRIKMEEEKVKDIFK